MKMALTSFYLPSTDKIGVGYQAHYMAQALVARGHDVTMYSPAPQVTDALYKHTQVYAGTSFRLHGFARAVSGIDFSAFDVLHSHGESQWNLLTRKSKRAPLHIRTIHGSCLEEAIHIRGLSPRLRMLYIATMEILSYFAADITVAVSQNTRRYAPWIPEVIPNGVSIESFSPGQKSAKPCILFVGTYENRKRGKWLIDVFRKFVRSQVPDSELRMVCSDVPEDDRGNGVIMLGKLTLDELAEEYRRSWVFCLPSTYEGFGVPYIEAMASGTAVVATGNIGAKEVLSDGDWGVICTDNRLGEELCKVLFDREHRMTFEQKGLLRATEFSWQKVLDQYEALYRLQISK